MHLTLLVAGALLPAELASALSTSLTAPRLQARLARASLAKQPRSIAANDGNAHLDWVADRLFNQNAPAPTAPYAYAHLSGVKPRAFVWHADLIHVDIARDHLLVQPLAADPPTDDESKQLMTIGNDLASHLGCEFVCTSDRWFLLSEHDWTIDATPLDAVIERPVTMPTGRDASVWNRLHNEIQMAWHAHPVNQARDANGVKTINAIWLHGGGRWKPLPAIDYAQVLSDSPAWQGAAQAAGASGTTLAVATVDHALLIIDEPESAKRLEQWETWLHAMAKVDQRLAAHPADAIDLVLTGATIRTYASRPSDRYKVWRRRALAEALTE